MQLSRLHIYSPCVCVDIELERAEVDSNYTEGRSMGFSKSPESTFEQTMVRGRRPLLGTWRLHDEISPLLNPGHPGQ